MAVRDTEAFLRERVAAFDSTLDITVGSPFDVQVIQPLARRLGTDPFSVDLPTFITARLRQAYPDMATDEGDALTDLLVKAVTLLFDPIVREVTRVKQNQSFADPTSLSLEEAEALGSNLFSERSTGEYARGQGRIYFGQPQNVTVSPVNYGSSREGLRYFPTEAQTIRTEEMLVNQDTDGTYYFDVNFVAEEPGDAYNIGAGELVAIANLESAVKVRNLRRFRDGDDEDTAEEYINKARGELTERSLVTLRGIAAKTTQAFPEVRRLNVVGFNDPEMQRDIITGGGLGVIIASGIAGEGVDDGGNQIATRRFTTTEANFLSLIGPATVVSGGFTLTLFNATDAVSDPLAQDFEVTRVVDRWTVEIADQVLGLSKVDLNWCLRKKELTLSGIPGGILFPDSALGTIAVQHDQIHIGGATDVHLKESSFTESSLILDNVTDDITELVGLRAQPRNPMDLLPGQTRTYTGFELGDLVTGVDYQVNSDTYRFLERAGRDGLTLQIVTGPNPTNITIFQIVKTLQVIDWPAQLITQPVPPIPDELDYRWRVYDEVNIDLVAPKETRVSADDMSTVQGTDIVDTAAGISFQELGVSENDILEILEGPDEGEYLITEPPLTPGFDKLRVDRNLTRTTSNLSYTIYRPNLEGGIQRPLVRIREIELLDSSNQPLGSTIPYAKPIDVQSRAFQNPAHGVKHSFTDVQLGIISQQADSVGNFGVPVAGTVYVTVLNADGTSSTGDAVFAGAAPLADIVSILNTAIFDAVGVTNAVFELESGPYGRFAIRPVGVGVVIEAADFSIMGALFGTEEPRTSADIRVPTILDWDALTPVVDYATGLDLVQVTDGNQIGFYPAPYSGPGTSAGGSYQGTLTEISTALIVRNVDLPWDENTIQFAPEDNARIQLGSRSIGSVRCYFLEPTSIEFDQDSRFSLETDDGELSFLPDPTLNTQMLPPLPSDIKSRDGESAASTSVFSAASQDFLRSGIMAGDELVIDYMSLGGDISLPDPISGIAGSLAKTLIFSIDNGPDLELTFIRDDNSLAEDEVTRDGVVAQINNKAGIALAGLTGTNTLEFEVDVQVIIRKWDDPRSANPVILGDVAGYTGPNPAFADEDKDNNSPHKGTYRVIDADETDLTISEDFPSTLDFSNPLTRQGFKIYRPGMQRISTTQMALNEAEADLFYFDVELVSEGAGDVYNIFASEQLTVGGYRSDGYYLTTDDSNLAFSQLERPQLTISKTILENGVDDDPANATQVVGQNLQLLYELSPLVADIQNFISSETERVVNESPLSRHLIPNFVRFDLTYVGGSQEELVLADSEKYIRELYPADALEVSDLQQIVSNRGATSIENPIDLIGIVHDVDRSIWAQRSQNKLTTGRLSAFIPDVLNIVRDTT